MGEFLRADSAHGRSLPLRDVAGKGRAKASIPAGNPAVGTEVLADLLLEGEFFVDGHAGGRASGGCDSLGCVDRQRPAPYLLVLHGNEMPTDARLEQRPRSLERIPELRSGATQTEVDDAGMRGRIGLHETADVAVETHEDPPLATAHRDEIDVRGLRRHDRRLGDVMALVTKPRDDWAIDVLVGEDSHRQAAELGMSKTSSVASMSAA